MKRFTSTELGGLVLTIVFVVAGIVFLVWPRERIALHATDGVYGEAGIDTEVVSKTGSRIYGVISLVIGVSMGALVLYCPERRV